MPRAKSKTNIDTCGDCGALEAPWASLNKGILLCTECCSVHRSLGRHVSIVKHLTKSAWPGWQQQMLSALNNNGANSIWEHQLLDNTSKYHKKKPTHKDPLSVKTEFIVSKHKHLSYAFRDGNYDQSCADLELGKQLHSAVRTGNLELSFRLLASGADPNYFHDEKGSTPLHVAVKNEQKLQIELLLVYGADPLVPDAQRRTVIDLAGSLVDKSIARRLAENRYEVVDAFSNFVWMQKPAHEANVHFLQMRVSGASNSASIAKLQKLPNNVFEELIMDVYDEVDRREMEAIWLGCADTTNLSEIPFLPVDSTLSSTRNQGRQKLARFTTPDFKLLIHDILVDAQRRENRAAAVPQLREFSQLQPDEDPLYDSVASDDDYAQVPEDEEDGGGARSSARDPDSLEMENLKKRKQVVEQLTAQLKESDAMITGLKTEVAQLRKCMKTLQNENFELKSQLSLQQSKGAAEAMNRSAEVENVEKVKAQRPSSMYETREGLSRLTKTQQNKLSMQTWDDHRRAILECTEDITRAIQQLCRSIQCPERKMCIEDAVNVKLSIVKLSSNFPDESEKELIQRMIEVANRLEPECELLQENKEEAHFVKIREYAFHLARFTKEVVTKYSASA